MSLLKITRKGERKGTPEGSEEVPSFARLSRDELGVSDAASFRIEQLMHERQDPKLFLRVAIRGGGCSGLSIHYELSTAIRSTDKVFIKGQAQVVIDPKSLSILGGATLHCRDYLGSKEFMLVNNPAEKQCSCGQSFSL